MLRRHTPLKRTRFMRSTRKSKYRRRPRHPEFMAFVRRLACAARTLGPCSGRIEADHVGPRGIGQKSDDRLTIPLCAQHHVDRTNFCGVFRDYDQKAMRLFVAKALVETQIAARELGVATFPEVVHV